MTERNNRIRKAIDTKSSQQKLADKLKISRQAVNMRLSAEKDIDSIDFISAVSELTGYAINWLVTGKGEAKQTGSFAGVQEPQEELHPPINRGEFYQELVETNSDYRLIPKSIIEGDYRIILKSELDELNRTRDMIIQAKDQTIALMDKRIAELEQERARSLVKTK